MRYSLRSAAAWTEYAILQWPHDGLAWLRARVGQRSGQSRGALLTTVDLAIIAVALVALAKAFGQ
jgi:hypothetical protein